VRDPDEEVIKKEFADAGLVLTSIKNQSQEVINQL